MNESAWWRRAKVLAVALAVAFLLHTHYLLMWYERDFFRRNYPEVYNGWANDGSFTVLGAYSAEWDNPTIMAARVRMAGEGLLPIAYDPYIKENRSTRLLMSDPAFFGAFGFIQRLTGDIHVTWHAARALFCVIWVLLLYLIFRRAGVEGGGALFWAATVTLFLDVILNLRPYQPLTMIKDTLRSAFWIFGKEMQWFGPLRVIQPLFAFAVLLAAGFYAVKVANSERGWGVVAVSGILGAIVTHSHADVLVAYYSGMPIFILLKFLAGKGFDRRLTGSLVISILLSLPTILVTHRTLEEWTEVLQTIYSRRVNLPSFVYLALGAWIFWRKRDRIDLLWWASLSVGVFLLSNSHLITGVEIEPYHYQWLGNLAATILLISWFGSRWPARETCRWMLIIVSLIALTRAISYAAQHYQSYAIPRDMEEGFAWLDRNAEPGSVVGSLSFEVTVLTPVYSRNHTLVTRNSMLISDISHAESALRFKFLCHLLAISPENLIPVLTRHMPGYVVKAVSEGDDRKIRETREDFNGLDHFFIGGRYDYITGVIRKTLTDPEVVSFAVDYLWVGPVERRRGLPADFPASSPFNMEAVYRNETVTIYRVIGPKAGRPDSSRDQFTNAAMMAVEQSVKKVANSRKEPN